MIPDRETNPLSQTFFHLHLVSDATGETLTAVARAAAVQYASARPIEHVYPLVRTQRQLDRVISEIEGNPGIVLFTIVNSDLTARLETKCREFGVPCVSVLAPVLDVFRSYLGVELTPRVGAQHTLDAAYFQRIDALNFTMVHDDGQLQEDVEDADIVLVGISRTSKTPTSIYLANRGFKTLNVPLVPNIPIDPLVLNAVKPLVVGLIASPERIVQIRENRLLALNADTGTDYVDRTNVSQEIAASRRLFMERGWPMIDVTRRSIEETAAGIIALHTERRQSGRISNET